MELTTGGQNGNRLSDKDKRALLIDARYAPAWVAEIMRHLADSGKD